MMQALDREAGKVDAGKRIDIEKLLGRNNVVALDRVPTPAPRSLRNEADSYQSRPASRQLRWAAGIAVIGIVLGLLWSVNGTQTFTTAIGEQRAVELEDGSIVHLNAHSRLAVDLSTKFRDIQLAEGEALFKVAHDSARPFRVSYRRYRHPRHWYAV